MLFIVDLCSASLFLNREAFFCLFLFFCFLFFSVLFCFVFVLFCFSMSFVAYCFSSV